MRNLIPATILAMGTIIAPAAHAVTVYATEIDAGRQGPAGVGFDATVAGNSTNRSDPANALGAPDQVGNTSGGFYSLGMGGAAVFGFGTSFGFGAEVHEVTFGCNGPQNGDGSCDYNESADVYVLSGAYTPFDGIFDLDDLIGVGFQKVGAIANGAANTADGASVQFSGPFTALALVDTSARNGDGFDVDAVGVTPVSSVAAVPLPATALLLGGALLGLGGLGWKRRRA